MNATVKNELTYITGLLGGLVIAVGDLLPYLTPDTLAALGISAPWCQRISIALGLLLIAYRKRSKAATDLSAPINQGNTQNAQATPASSPPVPPAA